MQVGDKVKVRKGLRTIITGKSGILVADLGDGWWMVRIDGKDHELDERNIEK